MLLRYFLQVPDVAHERAMYALKVLCEGLGVAAVPVDTAASADLVYAPVRPEGLGGDAVWIQADPSAGGNLPPIAWSPYQQVPVAYATLKPQEPPADVRHVAADLVYGAFVVLTGQLPVPVRSNPWGVPEVVAGEEGAHPFLARPVVAEYVGILDALYRRLRPGNWHPEPRWPHGKRMALVLSHDVDRPFAWPSHAFYWKRWRRDWKAGRYGAAWRGLPGWARRLVKGVGGQVPPPAADPHFGFAYWQALEASLGGSSCFYVAVTQASDDGASPFDVAYDAADPVFRRAMVEALEGGWEIGLHASIHAWRRPDQFAREKERLEQLLDGHRVVGVRHHHWSLEPGRPEQTWRAHQSAGFQYDSSLGLNDGPGYRRGMCWPFNPFDPSADDTLSLLQVPPTLMDGGIFYQPVSPSVGKRRIQQHLSEVRNLGGAAVLDWHLEQSNPERLHGAGPILAEVLGEGAASDEIFWTSPQGLAAWWNERRARLQPVRPRLHLGDRRPQKSSAEQPLTQQTDAVE